MYKTFSFAQSPATFKNQMASRKRTSAPKSYSFLAAGGYNATVLEKNNGENTVHRFGRFNNDFETKADFERANGILELFNSPKIKSIMGPGVLNISKDTETLRFGEVEGSLQTILLRSEPFKNIRRDEEIFHQTIEYLSGGTIHNPVDSNLVGLYFEQITLLLMWFFYVAQAEFGFRHRDFKPDNCMYRILPQEQTFVLKFSGIHQIAVTTKIVPVPIDFDFASIFVTNGTSRNRMGTYYTAPIELQIEGFLKSLTSGIDIVSQPVPESISYDWFSIGMCLLRILVKSNSPGSAPLLFDLGGDRDWFAFKISVDEQYGIFPSFFDEEENSSEIPPTIKKEEITGFVLGQAQIMVYTSIYITFRTLHSFYSVVYDVPDGEDPFEPNVDMNSLSLSTRQMLYFFMESFKPARYKPFRKVLKKVFAKSPEVKILLSKLLSLDPKERTYGGQLYRHFSEERFGKYQIQSTPPPRNAIVLNYGYFPAFESIIINSQTFRERYVEQMTIMLNALKKYHAIGQVMKCATCKQHGSKFISTYTGQPVCSHECAITCNRKVIHK